ncbi:Aminomethyltransferase folate-binding domain-containing protein [Tothia fuscella]|uniref:Iron-sulfur cluster assembly factor IBA57 homolog, mitochondrial n=1 Tax=Tothia fuscella TaxID=1048955 RepID=A0A9P4TUA8_9PEZI|nr:Aminomethyltransferase folate-binding domain-containing protein [Tothia fuscella]
MPTRTNTYPTRRPFSTKPRLHQSSPRSAQYCALPNRTLVSLTGPDTSKFLQGLTTQDIDPKNRKSTLYTAFLNAQGRVLYDAFLYPHRQEDSPDEGYMIEVDRSAAGEFIKHLKRHKLRSEIKIQDVGEQYQIYASWGPGHGSATSTTATTPDPRVPNLLSRTIIPTSTPSSSSNPQFKGEEVQPLSYQIHRFIHGLPEGPSEIIPSSALPQESNFDYLNGIDFRKGCYLGQELTIRTQHTGVIRKRILPVQLYTSSSSKSSNSTTPSNADDSQPVQLHYNENDLVKDIPLPPLTDIKATTAKRPCGKLLSRVGNIGLALCRLESMTDLRVSAEGGPYTEDTEFYVGDPAMGVKVKAFVPDWLREGERLKAEKRERSRVERDVD